MDFLGGLCLDEPPELYADVQRIKPAEPDLQTLPAIELQDLGVRLPARGNNFLHTPRKNDDTNLTRTGWYDQGVTQLNFGQVRSIFFFFK